VVAQVRLENHARQLPIRAQAADDGVRVGAVAAERLQEPEAALQHGRRTGEPVLGQVDRCHAAACSPAAVDSLDGPAGAVGLQQVGARAGRDAGGGGDPRLVVPLQHRHGRRAADHPADARRVQTTLEDTELRSSSSKPGAVFKNGKLIERPDESEGGDQQVAGHASSTGLDYSSWPSFAICFEVETDEYEAAWAEDSDPPSLRPPTRSYLSRKEATAVFVAAPAM
jgi:hypothetical protein